MTALSKVRDLLAIAVLFLLVGWLATALVDAWVPRAPTCRVVEQDGCAFEWCENRRGGAALEPIGQCYVVQGSEFAP